MESYVNDNETIHTYTHTYHIWCYSTFAKIKHKNKKECGKNFSSFSVCRNCCRIICKCTSNEKNDDDPYGTGKDEMMYKTCECFYDMTKFITYFFSGYVITKKKTKKKGFDAVKYNTYI